MKPWVLISPASRGIGFCLAREVLRTTRAPLVVTARKDLASTKEKILKDLDEDVDENRLTMLKLDVLDEASIADAAAACKDKFPRNSHQLQLGFVLPGILFPEKSPAQVDADNALLTFRTNTVGPMLMIKHFSPFLPKKGSERGSEDESVGLPKISTMAIMSARVGSISDNRLGGWYSYRASKAAVNQIVKTFDNHLKTASGDKAMSLAIHPGTVKTDFSKEFWGGVQKDKLFDPEFVAQRLIAGLQKADLDRRGRCWDWDEKEVPP